jgi:hypothetical protein
MLDTFLEGAGSAKIHPAIDPVGLAIIDKTVRSGSNLPLPVGRRLRIRQRLRPALPCDAPDQLFQWQGGPPSKIDPGDAFEEARESGRLLAGT